MNKKILIVDDEPAMLDMLCEVLVEEGYLVSVASNGQDALEIVKKDRFDLVISDINMPGMKGYELLDNIKKISAEIKTALITSYDVHNYIKIAKEYEIGTIITKTTPFNTKEIRQVVRDFLNENVFGLGKYINEKVYSESIKKEDSDQLVTRILSEIPSPHNPKGLMKGLIAILQNAFALPGTSSGTEVKITVEWGSDNEKSGISVRDNAGTLNKQDVLYWIERNTTKGENGLSVGFFDEHGKGIYLTREMLDRVIINIKKNRFTEIVLLNYTRGMYKGYRPLWINEC